MSKALEGATEALGIGSDEIKRKAVAKLIIWLAQRDVSLDAATLRDRAVAASASSIPLCYLKAASGPRHGLVSDLSPTLVALGRLKRAL